MGPGDTGMDGRFFEVPLMPDPLQVLLNERVVLDTTLPILYIGTLSEVTDAVFVLDDADMHDCRDGHANKEMYLVDAKSAGLTANRKRVVVMRSAVISVSRLDDVVVD